MKENLLLNQKIKEVIEKIHPKPNEISFAVIDLKINEPQVVGYNADRLIYPASIYKVFVAAEILRQIDSGKRKLNDEIESVSGQTVKWGETSIQKYSEVSFKNYLKGAGF